MLSQEEGLVHEVGQVGNGWNRVAVETRYDDLVDEPVERTQGLEFERLVCTVIFFLRLVLVVHVFACRVVRLLKALRFVARGQRVEDAQVVLKIVSNALFKGISELLLFFKEPCLYFFVHRVLFIQLDVDIIVRGYFIACLKH